MPIAAIRDVELNYEIVGSNGPWLALIPGSRRSYKAFLPLAARIAAHGFRVLLHDRRNTGASQVAFDDGDAENGHWAEDLHALLTQLDALPAFIGGSSAGCRTSLLFYLRHRRDVRGLLLFRVSGGPVAARRLPDLYYTQFIRAAEQGGMETVMAMDHWRELIAERPANRQLLADLPPQRFIAVMEHWRAEFLKGVEMPVLGISEQELRSIDVPAIIIPGNDRVHASANGILAHRLIPGAELHRLPLEEADVDQTTFDDWAPHEPEMGEVFVRFMKRTLEQGR